MTFFHGRSALTVLLIFCVTTNTAEAKKYDLSYPSMLSAYYFDPSDVDPIVEGPLVFLERVAGDDLKIASFSGLCSDESPFTLFSANDVERVIKIRGEMKPVEKVITTKIAASVQFLHDEDVLKLIRASGVAPQLGASSGDSLSIDLECSDDFINLLKLFNANIVRKIRHTNETPIFSRIQSAKPDQRTCEESFYDADQT